MKRVVAMAGACVAVLVVVGCSNVSGGEAAPNPGSSAVRPSSSAAGVSGLPHSGAPVVVDPLPESVLADHPCEVLTPEQVRKVLGAGASEGERRDLGSVGPGCDWGNKESLGGFRVGFSVVSRQGLSAQYANTKPQKAVFRELDSVVGFPAVAYKDSEDEIVCTVAVGIANEYSVVTTVTLGFERESDGTDSCVAAETVSELVVNNLKAKAGR
ncbi:DUF3558 domain-containing protein [Saccharomonospora xinjiangensis]|uniref:DUF3558 domain-containing protein n=1 Tax=Saccharomonospora xinjiangensis TaxID=75294 RepID=UPI00106FC3D5|nr:DUF3558 domain-containing protein [Saccharomonospora xinjiangensis]QBQ61853.1 hypothetical protein EYD13_17545 [Saccharomonospora xinjiangensis]